MVAQYIAMRTLLDLCERLERELGARVRMRFWDQEGINLLVARELVAAAAEEEEDGGEE